MWYKGQYFRGREAEKVIEFCHPVWLFPWVNYLQITMTQLWQRTTATRHCKLEATLPSSWVLRILVARNGRRSVFYTHTRGLCPATQVRRRMRGLTSLPIRGGWSPCGAARGGTGTSCRWRPSPCLPLQLCVVRFVFSQYLVYWGDAQDPA
jgi:hypothetical protein